MAFKVLSIPHLNQCIFAARDTERNTHSAAERTQTRKQAKS